MSVGAPLDRIDGRLKVTGGADYASDRRLEGMLYGVPVGSTIAAGRVRGIDAHDALAVPGVVAVFDHTNVGTLHSIDPDTPFSALCIVDEHRAPLSDDAVTYYGQYVALVVADTLESAAEGAARVRVAYAPGTVQMAPVAHDEGERNLGSHRGDPDAAFAASAFTIDRVYRTPVETHNPIELHATVASWDGDTVTLYETSQAVVNHRNVLAKMLGVPVENVRVITRYLGSGFGGKLWPWPQSPLAAVAARKLGRPVKIVVTREQMFMNVGHRPVTVQRVRLSADADGRLTSLQHDVTNHTAMLDEYDENCAEATPYFYSVPNLRITSGLAKRHVGSPTSMRGPGAVPGLYATESALDELAVALKMDPVALRLRNAPTRDEGLDLPFTSCHVAECYELGAKKFGWRERTAEVGSMKRNGAILGWGVAGCSWIAERFACEVRVELQGENAHVFCGTQDIGTGTYTALAQIVSDATGIPVGRITVSLGDSSLPPGPISGGSMVTASLIPATIEACKEALKHGVGHGRSGATFGNPEKSKSSHSFGAHFVEVSWQPEIARLRVRRVVSVIDGGRIINPKMARNQIEGAIVMGVGMALFEETRYDPQTAAPLNRNFADYVVASNADHPSMDVTFLDYPDYDLNPLGARGVGEIGLAGVAAAITSAVHHATGVRVRDLPVKIEDLIG
ncbi:MAG TPA: xanthine dehydrogenase family protein molybdopterin-binding subunit [Candidatus Acidoferrales bacterium]|nr:xanthine dehydrogenase family protein molybdopterin-binding subunit [Candidatus Acidoferrales bacterium]